MSVTPGTASQCPCLELKGDSSCFTQAEPDLSEKQSQALAQREIPRRG